MPKEDKEREEIEFNALLAVFQKFIDKNGDEEAQTELAEELMGLRAKHIICHALDGFGVTLEEALEILRNKQDLSELDSARRDIIVAAVDNLVDFAVAEEYQMLSELTAEDDDEGTEEEGDEENDDDEEYWLHIFSLYNKRYASVENKDAEYAMIMAATLVSLKSTTLLTYMTQGDERVRPWHLQYEGYTAPKAHFPAWLIPPIEHQCRCFLVEDTSVEEVQAKAQKTLEMPDWFNPTFKESVALGGRIFSDEHPYFKVNSQHFKRLQEIASRIKKEYF